MGGILLTEIQSAVVRKFNADIGVAEPVQTEDKTVCKKPGGVTDFVLKNSRLRIKLFAYQLVFFPPKKKIDLSQRISFLALYYC